mmetsp:Transcript_2944/g.9027  ORF Transcript_2944/g.9027 Transcript_2944/m.9027 type:complete len:118 (+) Transcript_2944:3025-3378(+)|eukprot:scaffold125875_cov30-Tisochrysis_lutea.AAC.7
MWISPIVSAVIHAAMHEAGFQAQSPFEVMDEKFVMLQCQQCACSGTMCSFAHISLRKPSRPRKTCRMWKRRAPTQPSAMGLSIEGKALGLSPESLVDCRSVSVATPLRSTSHLLSQY